MTLPLRPTGTDHTNTKTASRTDLQGAWRDALARHAAQQGSDVQPQARCEPPWFEAERRRKSVAVFGLAVRGELPDRLTVEAVVALGCLRLHAPLFQKTDADTLRQRLQDLRDAGLLRIGADGLIDRPGVSEVMPMLDLPDGCALALWAADAADKVEPSTAPAKAKPLDTSWVRECNPLLRVLAGAEVLGLPDLLPDDNGHLPFSAPDMIRALQADGRSPLPDKDARTLADAVKASYPQFTWTTGKANHAARKEMGDDLRAAYWEGAGWDRDGELFDHLPGNVRHMLKAS